MDTERFDHSIMNDGINNNTYELLFKDIETLEGDKKLTEEQRMILQEIEFFTISKQNQLKAKLLFLFIRLLRRPLPYIKENKEKQTYTVYTKDRNYWFTLISYAIGGNLKTLLESYERYGKCHTHSVILGMSNPNTEVVTGYIASQKDIKILHTVLEMKRENKQPLIFDITKNTIMKKDDYVSLTHFEEINRFSSSVIVDDKEMMDKLNLSAKTYVIFRDELHNDYIKNFKKMK